ncbi:MAG: hypothetical protein ACQEQ1_12165 [Pseudomonadota bacterium]
MERHLTAAWVVVGLFAVAVVLAWLDRFRARGAGLVLAIVLLMGTGAVGVTGYLGAENVYRHGLGVERLPEGVGDAGSTQQEDASTPDQEQALPDSADKTSKESAEVPEGHEGHDHEH